MDTNSLFTNILSKERISLLQNNIAEQAQLYVSNLFEMHDIPRNKIQKIISSTTDLIKNIFQSSFDDIWTVLDSKKEVEIIKYDMDKIFEIMSTPFSKMDSEWKQFKIFRNNGTLIMPESFEIGERYESKNIESINELVPVKIYAKKVPLPEILKNFFELPNILRETIEYMRSLESETNIISNFIQGSLWKEQRSLFSNKIVFPLFLYFDEFETNNPLESHKGISKCSGVYINLPNIPPQYQSKLENIFLYMLFNPLDRHAITDDVLFKKIIKELNELSEDGVTIQLPSYSIKLYFQLSLILGDNLGVHSLLGFTECFNATYFYRFCKVTRSNIANITHESQCELRNLNNYKTDLLLNDLSKSGIKKESAVHKVTGFHVIKNLSVDPMHDFLEGICPRDIASILHHFIYKKKIFTFDKLNDRIQGFNYGSNYNKNQPPEILPSHITKTKNLVMSSAKMLTFTRNICTLLGDFVDDENKYWNPLKYLKIIIEIITSKKVSKGCPNYLSSYITSYLQLHNELFPGEVIPKHHLTVHYRQIFGQNGLISQTSAIRNEAKHQENKTSANS